MLKIIQMFNFMLRLLPDYFSQILCTWRNKEYSHEEVTSCSFTLTLCANIYVCFCVCVHVLLIEK